MRNLRAFFQNLLERVKDLQSRLKQVSPMQNLAKRLSLPGLIFFITGAGLLGYLIYAQLKVNSVSAEYQFNQLDESYFVEKGTEKNILDIMEEVEASVQEETAAEEQNEDSPEYDDELKKKRARYLLEQLQAQGLYMPANPEPSTWKGDEENPEVFARMIIPKIELIAPVVRGIAKEDIKLAVGHIPGTEEPGEMGNSVYAGHRSHTFGRFFNRLGEIEVGDVIIIETTEYKFTYVVSEKFIVDPDEVWVMDDIPGEALLTLVTCEPLYGNSHRLIVRGKLQ